MKKLSKLLLIVTLVLVMVVTGCGQKEAEPVETSTSTEAETISSETVASDAEAEASDALEHVNLSWYYIGSEQPDEEAVFAAANEIIKAEINATVDFVRLGWGGDYEQKKCN